jgi:hypothetical protein
MSASSLASPTNWARCESLSEISAVSMAKEKPTCSCLCDSFCNEMATAVGEALPTVKAGCYKVSASIQCNCGTHFSVEYEYVID